MKVIEEKRRYRGRDNEDARTPGDQKVKEHSRRRGVCQLWTADGLTLHRRRKDALRRSHRPDSDQIVLVDIAVDGIWLTAPPR